MPAACLIPLHKLKKQRAFSLLEVLLVLACIAAITAWTVHHFQQRKRRAEVAQIATDVKTLQRALDNYFHEVGCLPDGVFADSSASVIPVDCNTQLASNDVVCARSPLVSQYSASIIKTTQTVGTNPEKPLYRLQVQAVMNSSQLSPDQVAWYRQELRGDQQSADFNSIIWSSLPSNSYVQHGDNLWIINGAGAVFRQTENQRSGNLTGAESSGSFCAN